MFYSLPFLKAGLYETPACETLEIELNAPILEGSLGSTIGEYEDDGNNITF